VRSNPIDTPLDEEMDESLRMVACGGSVGRRHQSELMWIDYVNSQRQRGSASGRSTARESSTVMAPQSTSSLVSAARQARPEPSDPLSGRMGLTESRNFAIKQRDNDERIYSSQESKNFSDAYLGGKYEKPLLRSQMYDMLAEEQRNKEKERLGAMTNVRSQGPHLDNVDPHPLEGRVLNYPPPEWLAYHPIRPAVGASPIIPPPWAFPIDSMAMYPEVMPPQVGYARSTPSRNGHVENRPSGGSQGWVKYF